MRLSGKREIVERAAAPMSTATVVAFDGRYVAVAVADGKHRPDVMDLPRYGPDDNPIVMLLERAKADDLREIVWAESADWHTAEVLESYGLPVVMYPMTFARLQMAFTDYPHPTGSLAAVLAFDRAMFYRSQMTEKAEA